MSRKPLLLDYEFTGKLQCYKSKIPYRKHDFTGLRRKKIVSENRTKLSEKSKNNK